MKNILLILLIFPASIAQGQIIPAPANITKYSGSFKFDDNISLIFNSQNDSLKDLAEYFESEVSSRTGIVLPFNHNKKKNIEFELNSNYSKALGREGYQLKVNQNNILIKANTTAGIFYGIQSILQYFPGIRTNEQVQIPAMEITDKPQFGWRGMMLDVSRHFYSVDAIKEILNLMATYKMNKFHWHLTDNEGWRLEIKKYPKLTSVGAWREEIPGSVMYKKDSTYKQELTGKPYTYGGYYTQEQAKEIVAYAKARNITVIPEIEMPGHSAAALAAYPQFSCSEHPQETPNSTLWNGVVDTKKVNFNYCAGKESTFHFLQDVLLEVMAIFPTKYIHVGGDEVDKTYWEECANCQKRIAEEGLEDEDGLQSYFIKRIEKFLNAYDRKLIGWDEILQGGLAPSATVMSWRGEKGGIAAAQQGHNVVMSPSDPLYFNRYQAGPEGEPFASKYSINTLKKVYNYNPIPAILDTSQEKYVLGAQFAVWTEFISSVEHLEYMLLPRLTAFAEAVWTQPENKDFQNFIDRLNQQHFDGWKQRGIRFHPTCYKKSSY